MATVRGKADVKRFMVQLPGQIEAKLLRGAARAAATVVAIEAKDRLGARQAITGTGEKVLIADAVHVTTKREGPSMTARVLLKGPGAYVAPWLEYGTEPHFISVDSTMANGRSAGRVNRLDKKAADEGRSGPGQSLVIGGHFVGATVHHPGAKPHPFLRVSLDLKEPEAIATAQSYINARVTPAGIVGGDEEGDDT